VESLGQVQLMRPRLFVCAIFLPRERITIKIEFGCTVKVGESRDSREKMIQIRAFSAFSFGTNAAFQLHTVSLNILSAFCTRKPSRKTPKRHAKEYLQKQRKNDGDTTNQNSIIMIQAGTMWRQNIVKAVARVDASVSISSKQQQ